MVARVQPAAGPVDGRMNVPGSKSITNRALICAALAAGKSVLTNASDSNDTALMLNGLNQMGVLGRQTADGLVVEGSGGSLTAPRFPIPVGNAGTTFRFLLSAAALARGTTKFELSPRMAERPIDDLVEGLDQLGVTVERDLSGLFVSVRGGGIRGGRVSMRGDRSSQFLSSLLLAAPFASEDLVLSVREGLSSAPYVHMTLAVMAAFGVEGEQASRDVLEFRVRAHQRYRATRFAVEPDASGASYPLAVAAVAGGKMRVDGLTTRSAQGDAGFARVLALMGCIVEEDGSGLTVERRGTLHGIDIDMNPMPDVVPTLVAVALFAEGATRIHNVGHLRFKESNRLETLAGEAGILGARIEVQPDGLSIQPGDLHGGRVSAHEDHRLAMMFALIGLHTPGVIIEGVECVRKSYPAFWEELGAITPVLLS
ncbi:MAG: 3-phosphoshikimate 1-carboxyvinyltransferase [Bacteroidota bacterium]